MSTLPLALEKLVRAKAKAGRYDSASEVVREALRIMEEREARRSTPVSTPCGVEKVWMARRSSVLWSGKGQRVSEAPRPGRERSLPSFREGEPRFTDPRAEGRSPWQSSITWPVNFGRPARTSFRCEPTCFFKVQPSRNKAAYTRGALVDRQTLTRRTGP